MIPSAYGARDLVAANWFKRSMPGHERSQVTPRRHSRCLIISLDDARRFVTVHSGAGWYQFNAEIY
jgi:hypothetical protein